MNTSEPERRDKMEKMFWIIPTFKNTFMMVLCFESLLGQKNQGQRKKGNRLIFVLELQFLKSSHKLTVF